MKAKARDALENENVSLVWPYGGENSSPRIPCPAQLEGLARDIIRRAVALGMSLERHPASREVQPEYEKENEQ